MFRDRTNLFLSYRQTFPHARTRSTRPNVSSKAYRDETRKGLLTSSSGDIEMQSFSPNSAHNSQSEVNYSQMVLDIDHNGSALIERIGINLKQLDSKYKRIILPNFDDEFINKEMQSIDDLSGHIMVQIQDMYSMINQLQQLDSTLVHLESNMENPYHDQNSAIPENVQSIRSLVDNLKRKFAIIAQEITGQFREMQGRYIKYLKKDELDEATDSNNPFSGQNGVDVESYSRNAMVESSKQIQMQQKTVSNDYILQREREIYKISQSVVEMSVIFKELENIVLDQGTILDNITYNLDKTSEQVQGASHELKKAEGYQKQTGKCKLIFFLILLILFVLMLFLVKPKSTTKYVQAPPKDHAEDSTGPVTDEHGGNSNDGETLPDDISQDIQPLDPVNSGPTSENLF